MKIRNFFQFMLRNLDLTATTALIVILTATIATTTYVIAATTDTTNLTQTISAGTLSVGFVNSGLAEVADPVITFGGEIVPIACLTGDDRPTGELGQSTQMIYVLNPGATTGAWQVNLAATDGTTALWENGDTSATYDFNDPTTSGCTDGDPSDADSVGGQMEVNTGSATVDYGACQGCTTNLVTAGAGGSFEEGVTDSIGIFGGAAGSDDVGDWLIFGIDLFNTLPTQQAADTYTLDMTIEVVGS
jgi:hypothetical protein